MKKRIFGLVLALSMLFCLAAASAAPAYSLSGPVTIEFWHPISNQAHAAVLEVLVNEFNEGVGKELGITVNPTFQGSGSELYTKVVAAIKAGTAPDVTVGNRYHIANYLETEYVVDLTPYVNDPDVGIADFDDFFPNLAHGGYEFAKEGLFTLPIHTYTEVLFYNKGFFEANSLTVPTTWDELTEVSRQITAITGKPAFGWDNLCNSFMDLCYQYGGSYTTTDGEMLFEADPVSLQVIQMWQDNVKEGIWRTAGEDKFFSGPFANEVVQMYIGDSVEASYIGPKNPDLNWGAAMIPQANADAPRAVTGGHVAVALNMSGDADKAYAAFEFLKFLTGTEANKAVAMVSGYLPNRQSVLDDAEYQAFIAQGGGASEAQVAGTSQSPAYFFEPVFANEVTNSTAVNSAIRLMMSDAIDGGVSAEDAIAATVESLR